MRSQLFSAGLALALLAVPAFAQAPPGTPMRVRGTVEKLDGMTLMVKSRDGTDVSMQMTDKSAVRTLQKRSFSDIKDGDYVASTGRPGTDGKLHAVEVRIFPEALRGAGEGQFPWDLTPDSVMTNATVSGVTTMAKGGVLKVSYKGKESEYIVDADTPVLAFGPGDNSLLKPGTYVVVLGLKQPDGKIVAGNITAEANGIKPPM
jgi:hypothetical protein